MFLALQQLVLGFHKLHRSLQLDYAGVLRFPPVVVVISSPEQTEQCGIPFADLYLPPSLRSQGHQSQVPCSMLATPFPKCINRH